MPERSWKRALYDGGWIWLIALMAAASALILYLGRDFTFYSDEWFFVLYRDGATLENYLAGHGGHLVVLHVLLFLTLLKTVGLDHYWVFRVVALIPLLSCVALLFALIRKRLGPTLALVPAGLLLFLGSGWEDLLRPFQITFTAALASGLAALIVLDRDRLKWDFAACGLLIFGLGWSAAAVPFIAAVAAGLIARRRFWKRVWVPALPALVYPLWSPRYSDVPDSQHAPIGEAISFAARMVEDAVGGITGLPHWPAVAVALVLAILVCARLARVGRGDPFLWEAIAGGAVFWGVVAFSQAHEHTPGAPRYLFVSAIFVFLIVAALAPRARLARLAVVSIFVLAVLAGWSNVRKLVDGADYMERTAQYTRAELGAMQIAHEVISPEFTPPLRELAGVTVPAGFYFGVLGRYHSSPADGPAEIAAEPEFARRRADQILAHAFDIRLEAPPHPRRLRVHMSSRQTRSEAGSPGCVIVRAGRPVSLTVPAAGLVLSSDAPLAPVSLRQFARLFAVRRAPEPGVRLALLRPDPRSRPTRPWVAGIVAHGKPTLACPVGSTGRVRLR